MIVCKLVRYQGRVQGVGFRYTTQDLARGYKVAGYVRNLSSGEVELQAEGERDEVDGFLNAVASRMAVYIQGQKTEDQQPQGFKAFSIRT